MKPLNKIRTRFKTLVDLFDVRPQFAIALIVISALIVFGTTFYFIYSAPPNHLTISSGPEGSSFHKNALKYAKFFEKNGVKLNVLTSEGSLENYERLIRPKSNVDLGFVQAGVGTEHSENNEGLVSLGSIAYQPVLIFYRGKPIELLSELKGKKISTGPSESGTHKFALMLLKANGLDEDTKEKRYSLEAKEAAEKLISGEIDAAFIMSESTSSEILHKLLISHEIHLYHFKQANAYSRKMENLNVLDLSEGAIDFGKNIPPHDIMLVGPMVEILANKNLHPALSDLLLEAATSVHSRSGIFQYRGEFPAPIEHGIRISDDANRFYKSGKSLFYRYLPFWLASLTSRIVFVLLPMLVVLIPVLRSVPGIFRWRIQNKIYRRYRELLVLENKLLLEKDLAKQSLYREHFDRIEQSVNKMKIPATFADQFYGLRGHIDYVRSLVEKKKA